MNNTKLERVACYIRVSTEEQKLHGISLDAQIDKLTEYANKHNLKIIDWYKDEGISGRKLIKKRPELQRMIKDAQAHKFDRIIFIKLDRFFRSVAEYHECMKLIEPVVWTATEEKYDLTTANGRAFVNMKITIAELEADQTGERIKLVNDYKVKDGRPLTGSQCLPYGYTIVKIGDNKKVVIDETKAETVRAGIEYFLTYQSIRATAKYLQLNYDPKINYRILQGMLKNTLLYGHYRGNDTYITEPYIDKSTFDHIQSIISAKNIKQTSTKTEYLYTGLLLCPVCGNNLASSRTKCKYKRKNDNGDPELVECVSIGYKCNKHYINNTCTYNKYVSEKKIEKKLLTEFNKYITQYIQVKTIETADKIKIKLNNNERIEKLTKEADKLKVMYRRDDITEAEYERDMDAIKTELKALNDIVNNNAPERDLSPLKELLEGDWVNIYQSLDKAHCRAFWRRYIRAIHIDSNINIINIDFL